MGPPPLASLLLSMGGAAGESRVEVGEGVALDLALGVFSGAELPATGRISCEIQETSGWRRGAAR